MGRNRQLMMWTGTLNDYKASMLKHSKKTGTNGTYYIYTTAIDGIWVWAKRPIDFETATALGITYRDKYKTVAALHIVAADRPGRGLTVPISHCDELAHIPPNRGHE